MVKLLLSLDFYTEYMDGVGDTLIFFMLPNISLDTSYEATLVVRRWDTALESSTLETFKDIATTIQIQKVDTIIEWVATVRIL